MSDLKGKTIIITGSSRGIGREMALRFARDGANLVIAAKSADPHPKLPGTIHSRLLPKCSRPVVRLWRCSWMCATKTPMRMAAQRTADVFGGIDAVINNAGAIKLTGAEITPLKRFDLMHQINTRAVLGMTQAALPWLKKSRNPHVLNLSPPLNMNPKWFKTYGPYTLTKYGMSMLTLAMSEEFRRYGIAVNSLWPRTLIATAAVEFEAGSAAVLDAARKPAIMADAAYAILTQAATSCTGQWLIDEAVLRAQGTTDFEEYRHNLTSGKPLVTDLFIDD
jgi:citronellol/citronellal dehydrogenase